MKKNCGDTPSARLTNSFCRYMADKLRIRRKTQFNQLYIPCVFDLYICSFLPSLLHMTHADTVHVDHFNERSE